jgi:hypothetical protein
MFSNDTYNLTEKEQKFIQTFLSMNDCGAVNPEELLADNFSCQCTDDLKAQTTYSAHEIAGYLSSLSEKNVLEIESRNSNPDLYWVASDYLETLPKELSF